MVAHPVHTDLQEARDVSGKEGPLRHQPRQEWTVRGWDLCLEDRQRDWEGEHAIGESFEASLHRREANTAAGSRGAGEAPRDPMSRIARRVRPRARLEAGAAGAERTWRCRAGPRGP